MDETPEKDHADGDSDAVYERFWKPLVEPDGVLDPEQVKLELYDFYVMMGTFTTVYGYLTNGRLSKLTYAPEVYIQEIERALQAEFDQHALREGDREGNGDDPPTMV